MNLKTLLMILVLALLGTVSAQAQSFDMGFESGMNFSYFLGPDANSLNGPNASASRLGFVGGAFLSLNFGPAFALRPELLYEQKGAQISGTAVSYEMDYVEIPVLLKVGLGNPILPSILVGPSFDWDVVSSLPGGSGTVDIADVGLVGGIEYDFSKFFINGRYELGLNNVSSGRNLQNGTITILMGYSFF